MPGDSVLFDRYKIQMMGKSESFSTLRTSVDPRFSLLLMRATENQQRTSQENGRISNWGHIPSVITVNSKVWSPDETEKEAPGKNEKKSCFSPVWKNRLQGLLVGLAVALISAGIILGILLTRPSTSATTPTPTAGSTCSSMQWNSVGVTAAGNGTYGNSTSQFSFVWSIYIDANNALYATDYSNHRIQQWLPSATSGSTVAGTTSVCGSNSSLLCNPQVICGDTQLNLYIGDIYGINKWLVGASVGYRVPDSWNYGTPSGIFVDQNGNLYASFSWACTVRMWTPTANVSIIVAGFNGCGQSSSQLYYPSGLFVDSSTNTMFISNSNADTIVAWIVGATNGTIVVGWNMTYGSTNFLLYNPRDLKPDRYGNLYVADSSNNRIIQFCQNPASTNGTIIEGIKLSYPRSLAFDSAMNLYVPDSNNYRVAKFARIM